jgi:hypothetical protein
MTFEEILDQALAVLQRRSRLTYRTPQRQFQLGDAALEDLKDELICGDGTRPPGDRCLPRHRGSIRRPALVHRAGGSL